MRCKENLNYITLFSCSLSNAGNLQQVKTNEWKFAMSEIEIIGAI